MGKYSDYKLVLRDLPVGKTTYKYGIDDSFFKLINDEESDVKRGNLAVEVLVMRGNTAFELSFSIQGTVYIPCDRCLDDVLMDVDMKQRLIVKFGKEYSEESDEIIIIPESEGEINIAWFIYEFIVLSLPAKRVHPAGQCNKEVTQKLKKHRAILAEEEDDLDDLDEAGDGEQESDPRWDALKGFDAE